MKEKELNKKVNKMFDDMISSDFSAITDKISSGKGEFVYMKNENINKEKKKFEIKKWLAIPTVGVAALAVFAAVIIPRNQTLTAVTIDVNPGIELKVNNKNEVKGIEALNDDAKKIVDSIDVENDTLKVATEEIMQSMIDNQYITTEANSVLVTIEETTEEAKKIKEEITTSIEEYLTSKNINPSILGQMITSTEELENLATQYGISVGKAELINKLISMNPENTFENLVNLNTSELNFLINDDIDIFEDLESYGDIFNNGKYIAISTVTANILAEIGIAENQTGYEMDTEIDYNNNKMVYEIEVKHNGVEYEYEVDALTGTILTKEIDGIETDINDQDDDDNDDDDDDDDDDNDNDDIDDQDDDNDNDDIDDQDDDNDYDDIDDQDDDNDYDDIDDQDDDNDNDDIDDQDDDNDSDDGDDD